MNESSVGSFEAKNRLSELLDRAEHGERIWITRRGRRVAVLGPAAEKADLVERLRELRRTGKRRKSPSLKSLVEEGRRA